MSTIDYTPRKIHSPSYKNARRVFDIVAEYIKAKPQTDHVHVTEKNVINIAYVWWFDYSGREKSTFTKYANDMLILLKEGELDFAGRSLIEYKEDK